MIKIFRFLFLAFLVSILFAGQSVFALTFQEIYVGQTGGKVLGDSIQATVLPPSSPASSIAPMPSGFATGALWQVGPTRTYKKPSDVVKLVHDGDVVEIDAATYKCDTGVIWKANNLTLRGVGGKPVLDATGCVIPGDKGIWNPLGGHNMIVENLEFMGAKSSAANGAGIRYQASGYWLIVNCYFHDNEDGILASPLSLAADNAVIIDNTEFARNGAGDGQSHNFYMGSTWNTFVMEFSYSHDGNQGQDVKTRAQNNYILYNRLADEVNGQSSYNIDISQGGLTYIIGNIIQQGPLSPNYRMIGYAAEANIAGQRNPIQELYVSGNTIVSVGIPSAEGLRLWDNSFDSGLFINNIVVGISAANMITLSPGKITATNNLLTSSPGFFDQANRIFNLTSGSAAVDTAVSPGSAHGFSLVPTFEYRYPLGGVPRVQDGKLDMGAMEYSASQSVTPVPAISFTAAQSTVNYAEAAQLSWSATNATDCQGSGAWSGHFPVSGSAASDPLLKNVTFTLACQGPGGSASKQIAVTVTDSAGAASLGDYTWKPISGSMIDIVCAANLKDNQGKYIYADNFGTGPYCISKGGYITGVYVPDTKKWYLMGGPSGRNYYGNEIYAFNFETQVAERVTEPTHISQTQEYAPDDLYGSKVHMLACDGIMHLTAGGVAPATRGIFGGAAYNPVTKKIIVGPGGAVRGATNCGVTGSYVTDMWSFDPLTTQWQLLAGANDAFGDTNIPLWFLSPKTGIAFDVTSGQSPASKGGYFIDYNTSVPTLTKVDNVPPYYTVAGTAEVDTVSNYALVLGNTSGTFAVYDLNNPPSSYGITGSGKPLYKSDVSWTVTGDTTILSQTRPAMTFNPKLNKFVAWNGGNTIYFLTPNYAAKRLDITTKTLVGGPSIPSGSTAQGRLTYIPDKDLYLAFVSTDQNFYYLMPAASSTTQPADITAPLGSAVAPSNITASSASVSWTTDELSDSQVEYGASTSYGSVSYLTDTGSSMKTSHVVQLTNLSGGATYHYRVKSRDAAGNLWISVDSVFTTLSSPILSFPSISNLLGSNTTASSTVLSWATNVPTNGQVLYGPTTVYGFSSSVADSAAKTTTHTVQLSSLTPATLYHFKVTSIDVIGNAVSSSDFTFNTLSLSTGPLPIGSNQSDATQSPVTVYVPQADLATQTPSQADANNGTTRLINQNGTYYLIQNKVRHGVTLPGILFSYGFALNQAKVATPEDNALPEGDILLPGDGVLVKTADDKTVWLISNSQRHGFTSEAVFNALGFSFNQVLVVTAPELNKLTEGKNLDDGTQFHLPGINIIEGSTIYWIDSNNTKHPYSSLTVYNSWNVPGDFSRVLPANSADRQLPVGDNVAMRVVE